MEPGPHAEPAVMQVPHLNTGRESLEKTRPRPDNSELMISPNFSAADSPEEPPAKVAPCQADLWQRIREEVQDIVASEPILASFLQSTVLNHKHLGSALSFHLANKLHSDVTPALLLREVFDEAFSSDDMIDCFERDMIATYLRDSATTMLSAPLLFSKGYHALQSWRAAHWLWHQGREPLALVLQHRISVVLGVDIHPAAQIGRGIMFDHATGIVIGETAVVEDCVSIMQSVTLGGTGKVSGDRHPKVRRGVMIGPGAKILGNIEIGSGSRVIAASVVLESVPPRTLVAGVPAKVIRQLSSPDQADEMNQGLDCGD